MLTLKEASILAVKDRPGDTIVNAINYKNLFIFRILAKGAKIGSSLNYSVSIDKQTGEYEVFNEWDEGFKNPNEFISASKKIIFPENF